ncbi:MAG: radical SAM protein [Bacteroidales bacterium]|nr:radical SAM protein [Bacteroidales bacterium]
MLFENIIIGPIHSRRLGNSLGINLLPLKRKFCTYDCIYCECGWNEETIGNKVDLPSYDDVSEQLRRRISELKAEGVSVDSLTFAGNGEPTLHPDFPKVVDLVVEMRNEHYPNAVITLLTNATQLSRPEIYEALMKLDNPVLKLDAGTMAMRNNINKPTAEKYSFDELVNNLIRFGNRGIIQTLLLRGTNDGKTISNVSDEDFGEYIKLLKKIGPKYVMLYAIDRATPEKNLEKLTVDELEFYAQQIRNEGIDVKVYG